MPSCARNTDGCATGSVSVAGVTVRPRAQTAIPRDSVSCVWPYFSSTVPVTCTRSPAVARAFGAYTNSPSDTPGRRRCASACCTKKPPKPSAPPKSAVTTASIDTVRPASGEGPPSPLRSAIGVLAPPQPALTSGAAIPAEAPAARETASANDGSRAGMA